MPSRARPFAISAWSIRRATLRLLAGLLLAATGLAAVLLLVTGDLAEAHSLLLRSDPPAGVRLPAAPERVTGWFTEPLEPGVSRLQVLDGRGGRVDMGRTEVDPADATAMSVPLRDGIGPGVYTVTWETLSTVDGHVRFGSFDFAVTDAQGRVPGGALRGAQSGGGTAIPVDAALVRIPLLIGAMIVVGGAAFWWLVAVPAARVAGGGRSAAFSAGAERRLADLVLAGATLLAGFTVVELLVRRSGTGRSSPATASRRAWSRSTTRRTAPGTRGGSGSTAGYLRRQAMVAPGHVMLTEFYDHDTRVVIEPPATASNP